MAGMALTLSQQQSRSHVIGFGQIPVGWALGSYRRKRRRTATDNPS